MTPREIRIVKALIAAVKAAEIALDNSFSTEDGEVEIAIEDSNQLEEALNELDQLPNDRSDYELAAWGKAEWALRNLIGEPE